jgi:hypothetical protein
LTLTPTFGSASNFESFITAQQPQAGQGQPQPIEPVQLPVPLDKLTAEERAELRRQLQASLKMAA